MEIWRKEFRNSGAKTSVHDLERIMKYAIAFERIGDDKPETNPVVRFTVDVGIGMPFQGLVYWKDVEVARAALEKDGWTKETQDGGTWKL